jgi:hypothetical protein
VIPLPLLGSFRDRDHIRAAERRFVFPVTEFRKRRTRARTTARVRARLVIPLDQPYVDRTLTEDMLPIDTDYALSLFEAFIVSDAVYAAVDADEAD